MTSRCHSRPFKKVAVEIEHQEKSKRTTFFGGGMAFNLQAQLSPVQVDSTLTTLKNFRLGQKKSVSQFLKTSRSYGSSCRDHTLGAPAHETVSVVTKEQGLPSILQPPGENKGYEQRTSYPCCVEQSPVSHLGTHVRGMLLAEVGNDSLPHGLGSDPGQSPSRNLGRLTSLLA